MRFTEINRPADMQLSAKAHLANETEMVPLPETGG